MSAGEPSSCAAAAASAGGEDSVDDMDLERSPDYEGGPGAVAVCSLAAVPRLGLVCSWWRGRGKPADDDDGDSSRSARAETRVSLNDLRVDSVERSAQVLTLTPRAGPRPASQPVQLRSVV